MGDRSRVAIQLINNAVLRVDQNTSIRLVNISSKPDERSWLDLVSGALQSFSRQPWLLRVTTPTSKGISMAQSFTSKRTMIVRCSLF